MKKLLLVEDDFFVRDVYARLLKSAGFEVDMVGEAKAAAEKLVSGIYDLVILDIILPARSGLEILRSIRNDSNPKVRELPVVMLTNLGQEEIIKEAFKLGATGYLLKAKVDPKKLAEEINKFINQG